MTDIEILELFNEKAAEIIDLLQSELLVSIKMDANGMEKTEKLPDEKSLKADILTIRMFIQKKDAISFDNMSKLYSRINVPQDLKDKFNKLRDALNCYLNNSSLLGYDGKLFTNRELMDRYIYAHYAHCDKSKRKDFKKIDKQPLFAPIGRLVFTSILKRIILVINETTSVNQEAIQYLFWQQVSQESLNKVWNNTEDDVYAEEKQSSPSSAIKSLEQRFAFLKLPMAERRHILESQAETMVAHYQQESEWQELMAGDIIDY